MRILLADDQKEIRALVAQQLERGGHQVVVATNGQEALKAFERQTFDAVLLDEEMPMPLPETTPNWMSNGCLPLASTSYSGSHSSMDSLNALFAVPVEISQGAHLPAASSAAADEPVANPVGPCRWRQQAREPNNSYLPARCAQAHGRGPKRLKRKDGEKTASLAHALKGSVGVFGADAACHRSQKLQDLAHQGDFSAATEVHSQLEEEIAKLQANLRGYAGTKGSQSPGVPGKTKRAKSRRGVKPR